jgi:hypothetical protein
VMQRLASREIQPKTQPMVEYIPMNASQGGAAMQGPAIPAGVLKPG